MAEPAGLPLKVRDLVVTAGGRRLLEVAALDVRPGECLGIRGASGAGKSTLLYAVAGLLDGCAGSVRWGEVDLVPLPAEARGRFRAAHVGMIFQDHLLFEELSAFGNASLAALFLPRGRRAGVRARAGAALARLAVPDPGRGVASFSGGERQRVAVARALAAGGGILLADEPTASLHREAADALAADLIALARDEGRTLLAVSHDEALLARMDRVLTLADGRMREPA